MIAMRRIGMLKANVLSLEVLFLCAVGMGMGAQTIKHKFLAIDEGNCTLLYVDENDPSRNYAVPIGKTTPRDMQLIGNDRLLIGHNNGYSEIDIATGEMVKDFSEYSNITSARRLFNGNTLLAGIGASGTNEIFIEELDKNDKSIRTIKFPFNYVRLIRQTAKGTYLLACDANIIEANDKGDVLWQATVEYFNHIWKAVRLPNGNTLASAGYGAFIAEVDPAGALVKKYGAREDMPEESNPSFYATMQVLPKGHIVFANWQGHGPGHGESGIQLIEVDKAGKIVWKWSDASIISSLQGVLVLDGLNTKLIHDERRGVMEPLKK
jgi:hypothetical protein